MGGDGHRLVDSGHRLRSWDDRLGFVKIWDALSSKFINSRIFGTLRLFPSYFLIGFDQVEVKKIIYLTVVGRLDRSKMALGSLVADLCCCPHIL